MEESSVNNNQVAENPKGVIVADRKFIIKILIICAIVVLAVIIIYAVVSSQEKKKINEYVADYKQYMEAVDLDHAIVKYDDDSGSLNVYLLIDGLKDIGEYAVNGDDYCLEEWNSFRDTCVDTTKAQSKDFQKKCGANKHFSYIALDADETDGQLLEVIDGSVIYDAVDEAMNE